MGCLQDERKRAQLKAGPAVADEAALGQVGRLVAHGKRPDSNIEFFVELDVEPHPLEEICGVVAEIVEHVVRKFAKARIGRVSDRSEERRVGKEGVSTCKSRGSPDN